MTAAGVAFDAAPCVAIDIGASKVDVALVDGSTISDRRRLRVRDHGENLFDAIVDCVSTNGLVARASCVGVACAGPMTRGGETVSPLNIPAWRDFPLRARLAEAVGLPVAVDGDARALALAEGTYGAAKGLREYLSMVVSTGVGGGLVLDGSLVDGATSNAGHVGHLNVVPDGALCSCGAYGCLEAEASGWAIAARTGRAPADADLATRLRTGRLVGRAVGSLCAVLDFRHCFVAGSVAQGYGEDFFHEANKSARAVAMMPYAHDVEIRPSALSEDGPLLGAALVATRGRA